MEREHRRRLCNCSKATERRGVFGKFTPKNASRCEVASLALGGVQRDAGVQTLCGSVSAHGNCPCRWLRGTWVTRTATCDGGTRCRAVLLSLAALQEGTAAGTSVSPGSRRARRFGFAAHRRPVADQWESAGPAAISSGALARSSSSDFSQVEKTTAGNRERAMFDYGRPVDRRQRGFRCSGL